MKMNYSLVGLFLTLSILVQATAYPVQAEEECEHYATVIKASGISPDLQDTVNELFEEIHNLENAFRNENWLAAEKAVGPIDRFYNTLLDRAKKKKVEIPLSYLQSFEFSLSEIEAAIQAKNRAKTEASFLKLQPELFDILDLLSRIPLRVTASRLYVDMALEALRKGRFDVVTDELGEIAEYTEQIEKTRGKSRCNLSSLEPHLKDARKATLVRSKETRTYLERMRLELEKIIEMCKQEQVPADGVSESN